MKKVLFFAAFPTALFIGLYFWSIGPSEQKTGIARQDVLGADSTPQYQTVTTPYTTIELPKRYVLRTNTPTKGPILTQQLYSVPISTVAQLSADQLAVTIGMLDPQGLADISAVQLRRRSGLYAPIALVNDSSVIAYESVQQNYELSVFVAKEDRYLALVQTVQVANKDKAMTEMMHAIQTLRWQ